MNLEPSTPIRSMVGKRDQMVIEVHVMDYLRLTYLDAQRWVRTGILGTPYPLFPNSRVPGQQDPVF